jgi:DNA-binding CsgD family transcriptional regulator
VSSTTWTCLRRCGLTALRWKARKFTPLRPGVALADNFAVGHVQRGTPLLPLADLLRHSGDPAALAPTTDRPPLDVPYARPLTRRRADPRRRFASRARTARVRRDGSWTRPAARATYRTMVASVRQRSRAAMGNLPPRAEGAIDQHGAFPRQSSLLVGRADERMFLRDEVATAIGGRGRLVLIGGEAGIGKTALARDLGHSAKQAGVCVLTGYCYDLTSTSPYGPWLDLFDNMRDPDWPPPPAAFREGRIGMVSDQSALFAEVGRFLAELAAIHPVYVLLEDLHWADPVSIDLLRHVARTLCRSPILLVATYRLDELTRHHPLFRHLPGLVHDGDAARLELRRLDAEAFRALVTDRYRLTAEDEGRLVAYLERHADGNPFFAIELLRALEAEGLLRVGTDRSSLGELARLVVPTLLQQVIEGRIARLGEETRRALAIAAVIGQEVPLALWAKSADLDEEMVLTIIERAIEAHLLEADRDGTRVRFVHALTRETLYEGVLPPRRRRWHRVVAEVLATDTDADPDAVAVHFQHAGDPRACEWLVRSGDRAQRAYAWLTAAERLRAAANLLRDVEGQEQRYRELVFRVAYLLRFSDPAGSILVLDDAERLASRVGDAVMVAEVQYFRGIHRCYTDRFRLGLIEMVRGLEALEARDLDVGRERAAMGAWFANVIGAPNEVGSTRDEQILLRLHTAGFDPRRGVHPWFSASAGQPHTAVAEAERFIAAIDDFSGTSAWVSGVAGFAHHGIGIASAALGRPDDARRAWARSRELFDTAQHRALTAFTLLGELRDVALTFGAADPHARRLIAADAEAALGKAGGALGPGVSPRLARLGCLLLDGRWNEADRILRDLPSPGNCYLRREVTTTLAVLARHRGDAEVAREHIRALLPDGAVTEPGDIIHQEGLMLQRLAADLCLDRGDVAEARIWLEAHDRWLEWSGSVLERADGQVAWARWHRAAGDLSLAKDLAAQALALASAPEQPLVLLAAHRLLGEIETAAKQIDAAAAHLTSALDLAEKCEAPFERALTLLALAEMHMAIGAWPEAVTILDAARQICTAIRANFVIAKVDDLAERIVGQQTARVYPVGLTPREVDVLRLVARHQTDKEIAAQLVVSVRTVQTHVANILVKLGVENRRKAAAEADRLGLV